jgi:hypothetical protein
MTRTTLVSSLAATAWALAMMVTPAAANSTLPFLGNACTNGAFSLKTAPPDVVLTGRLTITDSTGMTLHTEEDVVATRTGQDPSACLVQFDIHFDESLLEQLLAGELFVQLDICGTTPNNKVFQPSTTGSCKFGDPAVMALFEPIDTLLDDAVAEVRKFSAQCPAGQALQSVDLGGTPGYMCTDEFALKTDLATEVAARMAADTALQNAINDEAAARAAADMALQTLINNETTNRMTADTQLQNQIDMLKAYDHTCPAGQSLVRVNLGGAPAFECRGYQLQVTSQSGFSQCGCTPQLTQQVCCCRDPLTGDSDPIGCFNLGDFSFCTSQCGTPTVSGTGLGSCTAGAQSVSCPSGTVLTGCSPGTSAGDGVTCNGVSGGTQTCTGPASGSAGCDCNPVSGGITIGCGVACNITVFGSTQTVNVLSSQAMCAEVVQN